MRGPLKKMLARLESPVHYRLPVGETYVDLNPMIGKRMELAFTGTIFCVHCSRPTKKSFNQGYCYPCFIKLAQCDRCIVKPELCHYEAGTCREPDWAEIFCFQPHVVYLANSSGLKVGITRLSQIPTRWIDQGAVQAVPIIQVASRYLSGLAEVIIAKHIGDKTIWQKMLKNQVEALDLDAKREEVLSVCVEEMADLEQRAGPKGFAWLNETKAVDIHYPVETYPAKVTAFNFDKMPRVSGVLHGIKGQYLIFDGGVLNIRKFAGYEVELSL